MPKVGNKTFPYTREGIAQAKGESSATGQKIRARSSYADVARNTAAKQRAARAAQPMAPASLTATPAGAGPKPAAATKHRGVSMVRPPADEHESAAEAANESPASELKEGDRNTRKKRP